MTDEANIAEAELAKVIAAALGLHSYQRNEAARGNFCIVCTASFAECIAQHSMDRFQTKKITNALLASGYAKRSDTIEECRSALVDMRAPIISEANVCEDKFAQYGLRCSAKALTEAAELLFNLKDKP